MARHLGEISGHEFQLLHDAFVKLLDDHDIHGSIARTYNLYDALDEQRLRAYRAIARARGWNRPKRSKDRHA